MPYQFQPFVCTSNSHKGRAVSCQCSFYNPRFSHTNFQLAGLPPNLDIYELLGLAADVVTTDIKKRFMRLSLLIHPDKCHHKVRGEGDQRKMVLSRIKE